MTARTPGAATAAPTTETFGIVTKAEVAAGEAEPFPSGVADGIVTVALVTPGAAEAPPDTTAWRTDNARSMFEGDETAPP